MQYKELPTWAGNESETDSGKGGSMRMHDMSNKKEKSEEPEEAASISSSSEYPYGLCLCLTEKELEKLGLSDDVEAGDYLHCVMMAKVTSVHHHHHSSEGGVDAGCRVELQIVAMGVEDESTEYEDDEEDEEY